MALSDYPSLQPEQGDPTSGYITPDDVADAIDSVKALIGTGPGGGVTAQDVTDQIQQALAGFHARRRGRCGFGGWPR